VQQPHSSRYACIMACHQVKHHVQPSLAATSHAQSGQSIGLLHHNATKCYLHMQSNIAVLRHMTHLCTGMQHCKPSQPASSPNALPALSSLIHYTSSAALAIDASFVCASEYALQTMHTKCRTCCVFAMHLFCTWCALMGGMQP